MAVVEQGFEHRGETSDLGRLLSDLWRSRALIRALARRDFYVRYRRPSFGVIWSVAIPLIQAIVLSVVFSRVIRVKTSIPYPVFIISGIVPWTFFSQSLSTAVRSITGGSGIASKVYFPRAVLPLASVGSNVYALVPTLIVLLGAALAYGIDVTPRWLLLIAGVALMIGLTAAFSLVLAALQVYFRDVAYILTAGLQAWFYGSAVPFPVDIVPAGPLRSLVVFNPATGFVETFRAAFMGMQPHTMDAIVSTIGWTIALLLFAVLLYRRYDRVFVDLL
jgi:ABC-type polysaccharide/polyol phosphate export permease